MNDKDFLCLSGLMTSLAFSVFISLLWNRVVIDNIIITLALQQLIYWYLIRGLRKSDIKLWRKNQNKINRNVTAQ